MRQHGRRLLALALTLALCLTLALPARAAEKTEPRDTDFFTPRDHTALRFSDMRYETPDGDAILGKMDALKALAKDAAHKAEVRRGFLEICDDYAGAVTMSSLAYVYSSLDSTDDEAAAWYEESMEIIRVLEDALYRLAREILHSPCAGALDDILTEADRDFLRDYEDTDEEMLALLARDTALQSEYRQELRSPGEIYLDMLAIRREIAEKSGYDNYLDYAYAELFAREYTPQELAGFRKAVRETLVPVLMKLLPAYEAESTGEIFRKGYETGEALDLMEPCVAALSDELLEAFHYLRDHGLIDADTDPDKTPGGFTADLPAYGTAFVFSNPHGTLYDLTTAIHEFGHFNNAYWAASTWDLTDKSIDIAEVHSQGLEMLFAHFYRELFGEDAGRVAVHNLTQWIDNIIESVMLDEFEAYAYTLEDPTVEKLNRKLGELFRDYGFLPKGYPAVSLNTWMEIPHLFEFPGYYISYGVSAAGAFAFWLSAREDYFAAVDKYLAFTALDCSYGFSESFNAVGLDSPLTARYIRRLSAALEDTFRVEPADAGETGDAAPFADVAADSWYGEAVTALWREDLISGTGDGLFSPDQPLTRAQLVTILWRMEGEPAAEAELRFLDVEPESWYAEAVRWASDAHITEGYSETAFGPGDILTREQFMTLLYRYAQSKGQGFRGLWMFRLDAPDAEDLADWAYEAACWMVMQGVVTGSETGALTPRASATRAQAAVMLYRWLTLPAEDAEAEDAETEEAEAEEAPAEDGDTETADAA